MNPHYVLYRLHEKAGQVFGFLHSSSIQLAIFVKLWILLGWVMVCSFIHPLQNALGIFGKSLPCLCLHGWLSTHNPYEAMFRKFLLGFMPPPEEFVLVETPKFCENWDGVCTGPEEVLHHSGGALWGPLCTRCKLQLGICHSILLHLLGGSIVSHHGYIFTVECAEHKYINTLVPSFEKSALVGLLKPESEQIQYRGGSSGPSRTVGGCTSIQCKYSYSSINHCHLKTNII